MREFKAVFASMLLVSLLFTTTMNVESEGIIKINSAITTQTEQYGPRAPGLEIYFYYNPEAIFQALVRNEIDLMDWPLNADQYYYAATDPNIILTPQSPSLNVFGLALNNNYTVSYCYGGVCYGGVRNPLNDVYFRRAIACMVNKDRIVYEILHGLGDRIDVPIPYLLNSWWNNSVVYPNYPYEYSLERASEFLCAAGFIDTDHDGVRNYPLGWPGAEDGRNLDPLIFFIRTDLGEELKYASLCLVDTMQSLGIPVDEILGSKTLFDDLVKQNRRYHLASVWEFFPKWDDQFRVLFTTYHSLFYYQCGQNYVTGLDADGLPNYPLLDQYLEEMWCASTYDDLIAAAMEVQGFIVDNCITISLWSTRSFYAYRNLCGVVNMVGAGPYNIYTLINAYRVDYQYQPIRIGRLQPDSMNPLYADSYDQGLLLPIEGLGYTCDPYKGYLQPWLIQDWEVGLWNYNGENMSMVTYYIRKEVMDVTPFGYVVDSFDSAKLKFGIEYTAAFDDSVNWPYFGDIAYTAIVDVNGDGWNELQVFFLKKGYAIPLYGVIGEILPITYELEELLQNAGSAHGFFLGNLPWQEALVSLGPYYVIDCEPNYGGHIFYGANAHYFLETPPLGEIDWQWHWTDTVKPSSGYFVVDKHDLVLVINALNSSGRGGGDPKYFPGADLSPYYLLDVGVGLGRITWGDLGCLILLADFDASGIVDIYDMICVAHRFGSTPTLTPPNTDPYDQYYDLNLDGIIDIYDIILIASRYGSVASENQSFRKTFGSPP